MSSVQALATPAPPLDSCAFETAPKRNRSTKGDFAKWLLDIAPRGTLMPYVTAIHREFYHISELLHLVIKPHEAGQPVLNCLEPAVWDTLGIQKVGHRMLFARGVLALHSSRQVPQNEVAPTCYGLSAEQQLETQNAKQKRNYSPPKTPKPPSKPPPARLLASRAPGQKKGSLSETNVHEEAVDVALTFPQVHLERARRLALATSGAATLTVQVAAKKT